MRGLVMSCKPERGSSPEIELCQNLDLPASRTVVRRDSILQFQPLVRGHLLLLLLPSHFSRVRLCVTPWTAAYQAPPAMGFSRQEYWSRVPLPSPHGHLS